MFKGKTQPNVPKPESPNTFWGEKMVFCEKCKCMLRKRDAKPIPNPHYKIELINGGWISAYWSEEDYYCQRCIPPYDRVLNDRYFKNQPVLEVTKDGKPIKAKKEG